MPKPPAAAKQLEMQPREWSSSAGRSNGLGKKGNQIIAARQMLI
jgi:hypothetical protein